MKKIYAVCVVLLVGVICFNKIRKLYVENRDDNQEIVNENVNEQEDDEDLQSNTHLKFKGVPIDGTLAKFVTRMKRCGYEVSRMKEGRAKLCGDFADMKDCEVYVETLTGNDLVSSIAVVFCSSDDWSTLYDNYAHVKVLLKEKYGKPTSCVEKFKSHYGMYPSDDLDRVISLRDGRCDYHSVHALDNGTIQLQIEHNGSNCYVVLNYYDKENSESVRNAALKDL